MTIATPAKEDVMMRETCFCGWSGEIADREPVYTGDGAWGLACPACGHLDRLAWLAVDTARLLLQEAGRSRRDRPPASADHDGAIERTRLGLISTITH
jgi:hypothetical protein